MVKFSIVWGTVRSQEGILETARDPTDIYEMARTPYVHHPKSTPPHGMMGIVVEGIEQGPDGRLRLRVGMIVS